MPDILTVDLTAVDELAGTSREISELDEVKCMFEHDDDPCSIEVTHMSRDCRPVRFMICANAAQIVSDRIAEAREQLRCRHCNRPVRICWRVTPI